MKPDSDSKVDASLRQLVSVLVEMDHDEAYKVLFALLTPPEREKIALRWQLVCMLEKGITQRAIASELGISLCKITRGSHELKYGPESLRTAIRKAVEKEDPGTDTERG